jgi:predicted aspartyl protease
MPIDKCSFTGEEPDFLPRPYLPIKIVNPSTGKHVLSIGLIDTGADACAIPAYLAEGLEHNLGKGRKRPFYCAMGKGFAYAHITSIEILNSNQEQIMTIPAMKIDFIDGLQNVILGVKGFLQHYILNIHYPSNYFSVKTPSRYIPPYSTP